MPQANRGERRLDRVGGSQVLPVFGREVIERQQLVAILCQAFGRLGVFRLIVFQEGVEGLGCVVPRVGHPDLMDHLLGRRLFVLGQFVQHVGRLVHPATLGFCRRIDFGNRIPETQGTVADRQLRRNRQAATFHIQQQLLPGLSALAMPVGHGDQLFFAVFRRSHQHQNALPILLQADLRMDAIGPHVDVFLVLERSLRPFVVLLLPQRLESRDRRCR